MKERVCACVYKLLLLSVLNSFTQLQTCWVPAQLETCYLLGTGTLRNLLGTDTFRNWLGSTLHAIDSAESRQYRT